MKNNTHLLKIFLTQLKKVESEIEGLKLESSQVNKQLTQKYKLKEELEEKISSISRSDQEIIISEHAILRYFERVLGFDLETFKKLILNDGVMELIEKLDRGNGEYPSTSVEGQKFKILLKDNVIVTIK